jgi:PAS domain S-box-containing protein
VNDLTGLNRDLPSVLAGMPGSAVRKVVAAFDASALYEQILERMGEGVSLANEEGIILYTNPAEDRMFGYEADELLGQHLTALSALPPEESARVVDEIVAQVFNHGEWSGELRSVRKDGTPFTTYARISAIELGERPHLVCVKEDLTERKRLHERTARLQSLSAALSRAVTLGDVAEASVIAGMAAVSARTAGLWWLSRDGKVAELLASACYPDEVVERLRRLPLDTPTPMPILEAIRTGEAVWVESRSEFRDRFPQFESEVRPPSRDYAFSCLPLVAERRTIGAIAFTFPRTGGFGEDDRVLLVVLARQCALALERARLYDEAQLAKERSTFLARASEILSSSLEYEKTLEALTRLAVPPIADCCAVDMLGEGGTIQRIAVAHRDPAREPMAAEYLRKYPIRLDATRGVGKVIRKGTPESLDVTDAAIEVATADPEQRAAIRALGIESYLSVPLKARERVLGALTLMHAGSGRRYTEADLRLAEDLARRAAIAVDNALLYREAQMQMHNAEEASRAKDEFLATVSHELRTPLTSILGWTQILRAQKIAPLPKVERALQTIERNARAQAQLIEDLLDVSRIIQGKMRLEVARLDPSLVIEAALESVRPAAEAKGIKLVTQLEPNAGMIHGDPNRIQQVVWNLLTNAIKFTPRGGEIRTALQRIGGEIEISVEDTGRGISPAFLPHVFERFRQADSRATRATGGLGLGLAIVRHLAELHGGWVRAESGGEGRGATFRVRLPVSVHSAGDSGSLLAGWMPPPPRAPSMVFDRPPALAGTTVVVVDDEHDTLAFIRAVLEECRVKVVTADCAQDGLRLVEELRPHVLISDIGMPGDDGIQFLAKVRALPREKGGRVPAVALTAFARAEDRARIMLSGFQMHVPKPVEAAELLAVVAALSKRSSRR